MLTDASTGAICVAADTRLFSVVAGDLFKKGKYPYCSSFMDGVGIARQLEGSDELNNRNQANPEKNDVSVFNYTFLAIFEI